MSQPEYGRSKSMDKRLEAQGEPKKSNLFEKCFHCGHMRLDHNEIGNCDFIKWIGGHPEYRCMCRRFRGPAVTTSEGKPHRRKVK